MKSIETLRVGTRATLIVMALGWLSAEAAEPGNDICTRRFPTGSLTRARLADLGIRIGVFNRGPLNAITDVQDVAVGHVTMRSGPGINTGVTAILPHAGNLFAERVPAAVVVGNGFGKLAGSTQVNELGELETPVLLTNTLSVSAAMEGAIRWTLAFQGNEVVESVNALVGETNDGYLNDIRRLSIRPQDAILAIDSARGGPVEEGSVGAGTGTVAFGWKAGIGTSSRVTPKSTGHHTVGVLVQANFGGILQFAGVPVGQAMRQHLFKADLDARESDGSVLIVIATDAPLSDRNLQRLARRAFIGVGRTGSVLANGSGDYAIAFSTHPSVRRRTGSASIAPTTSELPNEAMTPLFEAVIESTEEAVLNSLLAATSVTGYHGKVEAIPIPEVCRLLGTYGRLDGP